MLVWLQVSTALAASSLFCCGCGMMFTNWAARFAATPNTFITLDDDAYMSAWADPQVDELEQLLY